MSCKARECSHSDGSGNPGPHCISPGCPNFVKNCKDCWEKWEKWSKAR